MNGKVTSKITFVTVELDFFYTPPLTALYGWLVEEILYFFFFFGNTMAKILELKQEYINESLIKMLTDALQMAKEGRLHSFIGTGLMKEGDVLTISSLSDGADMFKLLGCVTNLQFIVADNLE
jgi:hypothetical protein